MRFKDATVNPKRMSTELLLGVLICKEVIQGAGAEFVFASINDSRHGWGSLHYAGNAVDFRSREFDRADIVLEQMKDALADHPDYDLLLENIGEPEEHFHLEYQPKS